VVGATFCYSEVYKVTNWTDQDLLQLDRKFAEEGIAFHARPFRAAMKILAGGFVLGPGPSPEVDAITRAYVRLIPEADTAWPGMGTGLAASVDRARRVTVAVVYGGGELSPYSALGFKTHQEWVEWCRNDPEIAGQSSFAFADMYDLTYGLSDLANTSTNAGQHWIMALSNLETVATTLAQGYAVPAVTQPICMIAELSMKAALLSLGADPKMLRSRDVGHNHAVLAAMLAEAKPHRDDALISEIVAALPPYVESRYTETDRTRLQLVKLAQGVQFIAASTMRRLTDRDMALQMEQDEFPGPRSKYQWK
jgi:hypothetical protein